MNIGYVLGAGPKIDPKYVEENLILLEGKDMEEYGLTEEALDVEMAFMIGQTMVYEILDGKYSTPQVA